MQEGRGRSRGRWGFGGLLSHRVRERSLLALTEVAEVVAVVMKRVWEMGGTFRNGLRLTAFLSLLLPW